LEKAKRWFAGILIGIAIIVAVILIVQAGYMTVPGRVTIVVLCEQAQSGVGALCSRGPNMAPLK